MGLRICHASDLHGGYPELPAADVYVLSGDILPNFIFCDFWVGRDVVKWQMGLELVGEKPEPMPRGLFYSRQVDHAEEDRRQRQFMAYHGSFRQHVENKDAPFVLCRGNHDFTDLAPFFPEGNFFEIGTDPHPTFEVNGVKFGGVRGINYINGEWSDEMHNDMLDDIARGLPDDLDVLVTHAPPRGILDEYSHSLGVDAFMSYVNRRFHGVPLKAHLFGHIHESYGIDTLGGTVFSNAATSFRTIDV